MIVLPVLYDLTPVGPKILILAGCIWPDELYLFVLCCDVKRINKFCSLVVELVVYVSTL